MPCVVRLFFSPHPPPLPSLFPVGSQQDEGTLCQCIFRGCRGRLRDEPLRSRAWAGALGVPWAPLSSGSTAGRTRDRSDRGHWPLAQHCGAGSGDAWAMGMPSGRARHPQDFAGRARPPARAHLRSSRSLRAAAMLSLPRHRLQLPVCHARKCHSCPAPRSLADAHAQWRGAGGARARRLCSARGGAG